MDVSVKNKLVRLHFIITVKVMILMCIVTAFSTRRADAILAPDYDLSSAILEADLLGKGRVIETRLEWVDSLNGKNIFTYVRFRLDRLLEGVPIIRC